MELEFALEGIQTNDTYPLIIRDPAHPQADHPPLILDWSPMIQGLLSDLERGVPAGEISARFHNTMAEAVVSLAKHIGRERVVLSGGCFQNRYLTERAIGRLQEEGFRPYWHQRVPSNDGGIALGQVIAALRMSRLARPASS